MCRLRHYSLLIFLFSGCDLPAGTEETAAPGDPYAVADEVSVEKLGPPVGGALFHSAAELEAWAGDRWDLYVRQGPLAHVPVRRTFVELTAPDGPVYLHLALYPRTTAGSLLEFSIFSWYTAAIQQELIQTGGADLRLFEAEQRETAIRRLLGFWAGAEIVTGDGAVTERVRSFDLPHEARWLEELRFSAAVVSAEGREIELTAAADEGFVVLFIVVP